MNCIDNDSVLLGLAIGFGIPAMMIGLFQIYQDIKHTIESTKWYKDRHPIVYLPIKSFDVNDIYLRREE